MTLAIAPREADDAEAADDEIEYEMELEERMGSSHVASRFLLLRSALGLGLGRSASGGETLLKGFLIHPDNRWYRLWTKFILLWAVYSSFFTPMEFAFFRGLPKKLFLLDIAGQFAFFIDIFVQFRVAYRDSHTYRIVQSPADIAFRYVKSRFVFDLLGCFPWDYIHKASGNKEIIRYLLWIRLTRACRVTDFFQEMEKDIRINYLFTRIVKLLVVELYCTHTAACIFYYLATTLPESMEEYTWIGSLQLGDFSYSHFREIDLWRRYVTSLYFAIVTMATVGYGDVHAVNPREMTERYRDKMKDLIKYMNKNRLGKDIRDQIKRHVRLQYENIYNEALVLQDIPASIRAKIFQALYKPYIEKLPLFKGCSAEFKNQIVMRLQEESFLPGEVILEQGNTVDQLYFVLHGVLDGIKHVENGLEEAILQLESDSSFGELAILCNIPQPYTVRVREFCTVLRIDKQLFTNILEIYFVDARTILNNLLEGNESNRHIKQLESDITFHIGKQEAEHALRVNNAAYGGDLNYLKGLISAGADPKKTDYDGRSPLHLAASRGYEDITLFLIQEGVDVNLSDKFGNTPLLEAVKQGHDPVASLLFSKGARLNIGEPGSHLCTAVARGDSDFIRRVLKYGIDPNSKDYDQRTPLHIAAAEGLYSVAKMLIEAGASVFAIDRWGTTPLDEAVKSGSRSMMELLENAKSDELSMLRECAQEIKDKTQPRRRCTVFPFHPWDPEEKRGEGVVLWIPHTVEELIKSSNELLNYWGSRILSEDGGSISDAAMISDNQKLYLVADHNTTAMNNT
ncbi:hypothetical protein OPV22_026230 [Ensete ventricosum]|uniref:Potassium channel n=1 Tax=Ensete ventricosum TaxID=4639 RepID=A0AAV8QJH4_ENSVE|nr:hypothetical protein OPV22_026230 [Ensete ventricosum]